MDSYVGFRFLSDYYFGNYSQLSNTFVLVFIGLFIAPILAQFLNSGFGNFILAREEYLYLVRVELYSNVIYVNILYLLSNFIVLALGFGLGGVNGIYEYGKFSLSTFQQLLLLLLNVLLMSVFISLVTIISILLNLFTNNEYILAIFPLALYLILPLILSSTLGHIFRPISNVINPFIIWDFQNVMHYYLTTTAIDAVPSFYKILSYIAVLILNAFIALILVRINTKKYKGQYL